MRRELTSVARTGLCKIILPITGLIIAGAAAMEMSQPGAATHFLFSFLLLVSTLTFFLTRIGLRLKYVRMDQRMLYVSDTDREIAIPLREIDQITESFRSYPKRVVLRLRSATVFGQEVEFVPRGSGRLDGPHPVIQELRKMIDGER